MKFNEDARLDPSRSSSGGGSGGRMAVGGVSGLVLILVALFFGIDPGGLLATQPADTGAGTQDTLQECTTVRDLETTPECRFVAYQNSIDTYWGAALQGYRPAQFRLFTGQQQIGTGCGTASSAIGPFYCPADQTVYVDESFFTTLQQQFGATPTLAVEAYVMGHEYGHHVQNQIGVLGRSRGATGPSSDAVRSELQADCFAGVWFANASADPNGPIAEISQQDMLEARAAAQAIGDDHIQENTTGRVDRESWTHGSSEQREKWLLQGYTTGDPNTCDTWSARDLG